MNDREKEFQFDRGASTELEASPDLWYYEYFQGMSAFGLRIKDMLHTETTPYQQIAVYDTFLNGKLLVIDGLVMLSEKDEFVYHEMIAHTAMQTMPHAKSALVIGGGDGGTIRELAKYEQLEKIVLCEIDQRVVEVCKEHIPSVASAFSDKRVECVFDDGAQYVRDQKPGSLDLIIVDSTDPIGPGKVLFTEEFYTSCAIALSEKGVLTAQTETPLYHAAVVSTIYDALTSAFGNAYMYWACIHSYLGNYWTFAYASKDRHPINDHSPFGLEGMHCSYYNEGLHKAAFALPNFIRQTLPKGHPQRDGNI